MPKPSTFRHLLLPLDGTPLAEAVLPAAAFLAEKWGARVTLLHASEPNAPATVHGVAHLASPDAAEKYLADAAARAFPRGVEVSRHVHVGGVRQVARCLADHVGELRPDLTIMCTHGDHGLRNAVRGSIAQQVAGAGAAPVLIFRIDAGGRVVFPFRNILVTLDGKSEHETGLPAAIALAIACGASIRLVTVVPTLGALRGEAAATSGLLPTATEAMLQISEQDAAAYLEPILGGVRGSVERSRAAVMRGDPADRLADYARNEGADLVVVGTHGRAGAAAFWAGSVAQKLIRALPTAFLLAPAAHGGH